MSPVLAVITAFSAMFSKSLRQDAPFARIISGVTIAAELPVLPQQAQHASVTGGAGNLSSKPQKETPALAIKRRGEVTKMSVIYSCVLVAWHERLGETSLRLLL